MSVEIVHVFKKNDMAHWIHVVNNGEEALEDIFCSGRYSDRNMDFNQFNDAIKEIGLHWLLLNQPPLSANS